MAKKKNRSLNIARKRAKRKQDQKFRRKQIAIKKQQMLQSGKSDEERLQERILQSRLLLYEPEFKSMTFDMDLMRQSIVKLLESNLPSLTDETETDDEIESVLKSPERERETLGEKFRQEVLPNLITPDFTHRMLQALKACETRFKRIGQREKGEVALVARSLFELADAETLSFHPLVLKVGSRTLEQLLGQPQFMREERDVVENVLSDVLDFNAEAEKETLEIGTGDLEETSIELGESEPEQIEESVPTQPTPTVSPEKLPAKALYKNFNGLETRKAVEMWDSYQIVRNTEEQVEFAHPKLQRYITLTADRLLLQCPSSTQLGVAMTEVEERCGDALFYLARTINE